MACAMLSLVKFPQTPGGRGHLREGRTAPPPFLCRAGPVLGGRREGVCGGHSRLPSPVSSGCIFLPCLGAQRAKGGRGGHLLISLEPADWPALIVDL